MVLVAGLLIFVFIAGFAAACFTEGTSRAELEKENYRLEIQVSRLQREKHHG